LLLDVADDSDRDPSLPQIQLLEGEEYRYEIETSLQSPLLATNKPEVFEPDVTEGFVGRVRPRLYTGTLAIAVTADGKPLGEAHLEVRSRKLDYLTHFRWMLRDIADEVAEVVMERFAAAEQRFAVDESADAETLYQRFAFLRSLLADDSLEAAIHQVIARPHVSWEEQEEMAAPGHGGPLSPEIARDLVKGQRRVVSPSSLRLRIESLPARMVMRRTETTLDTIPNQFVKFALTRWRDVLLAIRDALRLAGRTPATRRGIAEVDVVLDRLDELLAEEVFREVGELTSFPAGNQVLQKREGYRDVLRAYLQFELAAKLAWDGGEDIYRAGQRDVATLYEYWVFLQLAKIVAQVGRAPFEFSNLLEVDEHGLSIALKRGRVTLVSGNAERLGRLLKLELSFNRTFPAGSGSWSRDMRPDCSLEVSPAAASAPFEPVWLHFDAKYRVDNLTQILDQSTEEDVYGEAKRTDLLKMHSYRDAIRRSAGAYVVYPGSEQHFFSEYHELLPGLGAFALRPSASGTASGSADLARFVEAVLEHVATQASQHERGRYWNRRVYESSPMQYPVSPAAHFLRRPPADTIVLLGYVRGRRHLDWIRSTGLYNVRGTGSRGRIGLRGAEVNAQLVVLYGRDVSNPEIWRVHESPELHTRDEMLALGYPNPGASAYYCFRIIKLDGGEWESVLSTPSVLRIRQHIKPSARPGYPVATTWLRLIEAIGAASELDQS
jgi:predicted component of viral defense system (DUF524 family)